ncbi:hypothetical protein Nepgr_007960 [Nepenthes gracilis]|uniref:Uncharacterized protein n=1 Tax=Nepenthes gracilis TaxID=150966 RepID=A0AAD3XIY2_NEPGR|nr:hypothetical protein Nepgr_007960 [Nepenthes gracilis]
MFKAIDISRQPEHMKGSTSSKYGQQKDHLISRRSYAFMTRKHHSANQVKRQHHHHDMLPDVGGAATRGSLHPSCLVALCCCRVMSMPILLILQYPGSFLVCRVTFALLLCLLGIINRRCLDSLIIVLAVEKQILVDLLSLSQLAMSLVGAALALKCRASRNEFDG